MSPKNSRDITLDQSHPQLTAHFLFEELVRALKAYMWLEMALLVEVRHSYWHPSIPAFKNMDTAIFNMVERNFIKTENMLIVIERLSALFRI
jgi:hypothetical protein